MQANISLRTGAGNGAPLFSRRRDARNAPQLPDPIRVKADARRLISLLFRTADKENDLWTTYGARTRGGDARAVPADILPEIGIERSRPQSNRSWIRRRCSGRRRSTRGSQAVDIDDAEPPSCVRKCASPRLRASRATTTRGRCSTPAQSIREGLRTEPGEQAHQPLPNLDVSAP